MPLNIRRALISVSDKSGLAELARVLVQANVEILSTGGTYTALQAAGIAVTEVASYTGFPEMMDGRVKTLHPKIHGGILARRGIDEAVMADNDILPIDLVVVNLYPFAATIAKDDCTDAMAIENIDIGGPTMVRAAAKNHTSVLTVVDPNDYAQVSAGKASFKACMTCGLFKGCLSHWVVAFETKYIVNHMRAVLALVSDRREGFQVKCRTLMRFNTNLRVIIVLLRRVDFAWIPDHY
jgi:hypothetical protein